MKEIYSQENVIVPSGVDTVEFATMTNPKIVGDDATLFPVFSQINS